MEKRDKALTPLYFVRSGYTHIWKGQNEVGSNSVTAVQGSNGMYWSRTALTNTTAYNLHVAIAITDVKLITSHAYARSLRCLVST